jgi:hypothetical protein
MAKMSLRGILILGVPVTAGLIIGIAVLVRDDGSMREIRLREQAEAEAAIRRAQVPQDTADVSMERFRKVNSVGPSPSPEALRRAKADVMKHGDSAVPLIHASVYSQEPAAYRITLIGLLGEMKGAASEALLLTIISDRSLEERFRSAALSLLTGRPSEPVFNALQRLYSEEPAFGARNLVIRAIGASDHRESTDLLCDAARREPGPAARIQAVDSLGARMGSPGALELVRDVLQKDPEENVRLACLAALGKSQSPLASVALQEVMTDPQASPAMKKVAGSWMERRKPQ